PEGPAEPHISTLSWSNAARFRRFSHPVRFLPSPRYRGHERNSTGGRHGSGHHQTPLCPWSGDSTGARGTPTVSARTTAAQGGTLAACQRARAAARAEQRCQGVGGNLDPVV